MAREMMCITCPIGCRLTVEVDASGSIRVTGNGCARGVVYAEAEMRSPKRVVTFSVRAAASSRAAGSTMVPCKTKEAFPKERIPELIEELRKLRAELPIKTGDPLLRDALGTGIDVVATMSVD